MNERNDCWDSESYKTGSTQPPKSKTGLITALLVAVILLCGISTALGLMNIRLFRKLQDSNDAMAFHGASPTDGGQEFSVSSGESIALSLGVKCETVSPIYQRFYDIPDGVLMTEVEDDSQAARCGIMQSDILLTANGKDIATAEEFQALWAALEEGKSMELVLYRHRQGSNVTVTVTGTGNTGS